MYGARCIHKYKPCLLDFVVVTFLKNAKKKSVPSGCHFCF